MLGLEIPSWNNYQPHLGTTALFMPLTLGHYVGGRVRFVGLMIIHSGLGLRARFRV